MLGSCPVVSYQAATAEAAAQELPTDEFRAAAAHQWQCEAARGRSSMVAASLASSANRAPADHPDSGTSDRRARAAPGSTLIVRGAGRAAQ
jgi:hypothetical protein